MLFFNDLMAKQISLLIAVFMRYTLRKLMNKDGFNG